MALNAFQPQGLTVLVAASSSTSVAATQLTTFTGISGVFLSNPSTMSLYIAIGSSSVSAAQPTTAVPISGLCLQSGKERTFTIGATTASNWISAVTSAGTAAPGLFATPGFGQ